MSAPMVLWLVFAFLLGGIPFSQLIARQLGVDLRTVGSRNIGATNLARAAGYGAGVAGLLLDGAKGVLAVLLPRIALGSQATPRFQALVGALAVAGHVFSPFLRFKGGKGVATGAGVFAVLAPLATLAAVAVFGIVLSLTRIVGLASVLGSLALPVASYALGADRATTAAAVIVAVLVVGRHRANIVRALHGTEPRIGAEDRS
jgi:acyl phosphate:glycerol-3-phosphate acyltransferase